MDVVLVVVRRATERDCDNDDVDNLSSGRQISAMAFVVRVWEESERVTEAGHPTSSSLAKKWRVVESNEAIESIP